MAHLEFSISNMFFPKSCKNPSRKPFLSNKYFQKAITVPDGTINGIRSRIRRIRPLLCFFKTSTRSKAIAIPSGIAIPFLVHHVVNHCKIQRQKKRHDVKSHDPDKTWKDKTHINKISFFHFIYLIPWIKDSFYSLT